MPYTRCRQHAHPLKRRLPPEALWDLERTLHSCLDSWTEDGEYDDPVTRAREEWCQAIIEAQIIREAVHEHEGRAGARVFAGVIRFPERGAGPGERGALKMCLGSPSLARGTSGPPPPTVPARSPCTPRTGARGAIQVGPR